MDSTTAATQALIETAISAQSSSRSAASEAFDASDLHPSISLSVGLIQGDQTTTHHFGVTHPPDDRSLYEIGSVTKVFTAILLAVLVQEGRLKLDDPVGQLLPDLPDFPTDITPLSLTTHTSGLPRLPRNIWWSILKSPLNPYLNYSTEDLYKFLRHYRRNKRHLKRHGQFEYSNIGAGLLGHILETVTGLSYEQLIQQYIAEPLELADTQIQLDPEQQARFIPGYLANQKPATPWDLPTIAGAGALRSTLQDLLKFATANLNGNAAQDRGDLLTSAIARCHLPQHVIQPQRKVDDDLAKDSIGMGWFIRPVKAPVEAPVKAMEAPIYWHNGGTGGYQSYLAFHKSQRLAVAVLANSALAPPGKGFSADTLGSSLLQQLLER